MEKENCLGSIFVFVKLRGALIDNTVIGSIAGKTQIWNESKGSERQIYTYKIIQLSVGKKQKIFTCPSFSNTNMCFFLCYVTLN